MKSIRSAGYAEIDLRITVAEAKFNQLHQKLTNHKVYLKTPDVRT